MFAGFPPPTIVLPFCSRFHTISLSLFCSQVRQWIADRVTPGDSPISPSTSSLSPGPSSSSDWSHISRRTSPLRGPHGKFLSPPSLGPGGPCPSDQTPPHRSRYERHTDMAEQAKHVSFLFGALLRLPKSLGPKCQPENLVHFLCCAVQLFGILTPSFLLSVLFVAPAGSRDRASQPFVKAGRILVYEAPDSAN